MNEYIHWEKIGLLIVVIVSVVIIAFMIGKRVDTDDKSPVTQRVVTKNETGQDIVVDSENSKKSNPSISDSSLVEPVSMASLSQDAFQKILGGELIFDYRETMKNGKTFYEFHVWQSKGFPKEIEIGVADESVKSSLNTFLSQGNVVRYKNFQFVWIKRVGSEYGGAMWLTNNNQYVITVGPVFDPTDSTIQSLLRAFPPSFPE